MLDDIELRLADGSCATVARQGAQVLQWRAADGLERLFLSPLTARDGCTPIRGGVPICWPQFNQRVIDGHATPKHGFARNSTWALAHQQTSGHRASVRLSLTSESANRKDWPFAFEAHVDITLEPDALTVAFELHNQDASEFGFGIALHTYFAVSELAKAAVQGLQGLPFAEFAAHAASPGQVGVETEPVRFGREVDRVYANAPRSVHLAEAARCLTIEASESLPDLVVWNPGPALCATLKDMPGDAWRSMVCVEAAAIEAPVRLKPGAIWRGWQRLRVAEKSPSPATRLERAAA